MQLTCYIWMANIHQDLLCLITPSLKFLQQILGLSPKVYISSGLHQMILEISLAYYGNIVILSGGGKIAFMID